MAGGGEGTDEDDIPGFSGDDVPLTFMNNIGTGEGPHAIDQYEVSGRFTGMAVKREATGAEADDRLTICDRFHGGRRVQICCGAC